MFPVNNYQGQLNNLLQQIQQMQNMPQYQQPIPVPAPINSNPAPSIPTVHGYEGACSFSLLPNSSVILMDDSELRGYFKVTDSNGMATVKPFTILLDEAPETPHTSDFVTKDDLETMKQELLNIINKNQGGKKP